MNYSQTLALAQWHYGERWFERCTILLDCYGWRISTNAPSKGTIRPSSST